MYYTSIFCLVKNKRKWATFLSLMLRKINHQTVCIKYTYTYVYKSKRSGETAILPEAHINMIRYTRVSLSIAYKRAIS